MSTIFFFYLAYPALMIIHWVLKKCCKCTLCCRKFQRSLQNDLYYNLLITTIFESYLVVALTVLIGLQILDFSSTGLIVQSASCIIFTVLALLMPIVMFTYVTTYFA